MRLKAMNKCLILFLLIFLSSFTYAQTKLIDVKPGIYINGGSVTDSATKKSQPNIRLYCISAGDTVTLTSNARGVLSGGDHLNGTPDSMTIVSGSIGYHVTKVKIKVTEHGNLSDDGPEFFYFVELTVKVAKD